MCLSNLHIHPSLRPISSFCLPDISHYQIILLLIFMLQLLNRLWSQLLIQLSLFRLWCLINWESSFHTKRPEHLSSFYHKYSKLFLSVFNRCKLDYEFGPITFNNKKNVVEEKTFHV